MSPGPALTCESLVLSPGGRALSLELFPGEAYAIMGAAGSARAAMLETLAGHRRPESGSVWTSQVLCLPHEGEYPRRHTPLHIARRLGHKGSARLTHVLSSLGLWEVRQLPVVAMEPARQVACDLLPVFLGTTPVGLLDGHLDQLDPWTRETALSLITESCEEGAAFVVGTHLAEVAERLGNLVVFKGPSPAYAGSMESFLRHSAPVRLSVATDDPSSVVAMVEPFALAVRCTPGRVEIEADRGQELAARLLTQGYGTVRAVIVRELTLSEALQELG